MGNLRLRAVLLGGLLCLHAATMANAAVKVVGCPTLVALRETLGKVDPFAPVKAETQYLTRLLRGSLSKIPSSDLPTALREFVTVVDRLEVSPSSEAAIANYFEQIRAAAARFEFSEAEISALQMLMVNRGNHFVGFYALHQLISVLQRPWSRSATWRGWWKRARSGEAVQLSRNAFTIRARMIFVSRRETLLANRLQLWRVLLAARDLSAEQFLTLAQVMLSELKVYVSAEKLRAETYLQKEIFDFFSWMRTEMWRFPLGSASLDLQKLKTEMVNFADERFSPHVVPRKPFDLSLEIVPLPTDFARLTRELVVYPWGS